MCHELGSAKDSSQVALTATTLLVVLASLGDLFGVFLGCLRDKFVDGMDRTLSIGASYSSHKNAGKGNVGSDSTSRLALDAIPSLGHTYREFLPDSLVNGLMPLHKRETFKSGADYGDGDM